LDHGAIDGTVMKHNGKNYFVWASARTGRLSIYLAPFVNATLATRPYVLLRQPEQDWECQGGEFLFKKMPVDENLKFQNPVQLSLSGCVNEGPYFIYNRNVSYMIFSGSSTWDPGNLLVYSFVNYHEPSAL